MGRRASCPLAVEPLDDRALPSVYFHNGLLVVNATAGHDTAVITRKPGDPTRLLVTLNGETERFVAARIPAIRINGGAGNDLIEIDLSNGPILIPTAVNAGMGNDTIIGGAGPDDLRGQKGHDVIRGQAGADVLRGGNGQDDLDGGTELDAVTGGFGEDTFRSAEDTAGEVLDRGTGPDSVPLELNQAPPAVQAAVTSRLGSSPLDSFELEYDGTAQVFEAEYTANGLEQTLVIAPDGTVVAEAQQVDPVALPVAVVQALADRYQAGQIDRAEFQSATGGGEFAIDLRVSGRLRELTFEPDGTIVDDALDRPDPSDRTRFGAFASVGASPYFNLRPGSVLTLEGDDDGVQVRLVITILDAVKVINGVETRVVEEREFQNGELFEIAKNYVALGAETDDLYYFGEDVDFYEDGKIVGHDGTWRSGVDGARFGLLVPARPLVGMVYQQESAPGIALDMGEVVSTTDTVTTPAGTFAGVLTVRETTPLEPTALDFKHYAPGVGLVQSNSLKLTSYFLP